MINVRMMAAGTALAVSLLLGGCLDITKDVDFHSNGEARVAVEIALTPEVAGLMKTPLFNQKIEGKDPPNLLEDCAKPRPAGEQLPDGVRSVESKRGKRGDLETCTVIVELSDPVKAADDATKFELPPSEHMPKREFSLTRIDGASAYRLRMSITMPPRPEMPPDTAKMLDSMMAVVLGDRQISLNISAQRIENTNGELSPDKAKVSWRFPLAALARAGSDGPTTIEADIYYR